MRRPGAVKTREQLMEDAYPDRVSVSDRTIDSHVKRIRRKFVGGRSGLRRHRRRVRRWLPLRRGDRVSWAAIRGWRPSRIGLRLLAFNLLVVFVPVVGVLYLNVYETRLLRAQEESMVQQGRVLAAAWSDAAVPDADSVGRLFARLETRGDARLSRVRRAGRPDWRFRARSCPGGGLSRSPDTRSHRTPSTFATHALSHRRMAREFAQSDPVLDRASNERHQQCRIAHGHQPEVQAALAGRYGSATRPTPGQRSVTMFSAVPVRRDQAVVGAVLVSQSTFRILQALYDVRLRIFRVVVASVVTASVLTAIASMTIVGPLRRLRARASALADRRDAARRAVFPKRDARDEIGALARCARGDDASRQRPCRARADRSRPMSRTSSRIRSRRSARRRK